MTLPGPPPPGAHLPPPGQGPAGDPTAVMGRRIGAYVIDVALAWLFFALLLVATGDTVDSSADLCGFSDSPAVCFDVGDTIYYADDNQGGGLILGMVAFWMCMGIVVQGITGATPGKHATGLRVVDVNTGRRAGFAQSAGRTILWVVDAIPFVFPLVGLIAGVTTKGHRRVGDMALGTVVVGRASVGHPPQVPGLTTSAAPTVPPPPGVRYVPPPPTAVAPSAPPVAAGPPLDPFVAPADPVVDAVTPDQTAGERAGVDAPLWDPARNAYIQWDPHLRQWMTYDDTAGAWKPLT